ncbi:DotU family type IV/VI secretion system protein [Francisella tularensis subsp. novicida]|uniref:DotU family type IV/VI secretion system protein n=2 Tax=Francisella tularensis TaxID=263 RepID=A0A6I4RRQ4_FRATU|nr:DotU family type IV/VI secretion system protein [Francisella tularensis]ABK88962.1 conserved protein of unknown function [Francisella tularensis subsp. novicida U112]AJI61125.1 hypothetical protein AW25_149 [Francisella tularensis subsp. novicida U112]EDX19355.1 hypothetical protein FTE_0343 [Francisella tularensis subsp. novicida FTE]MBK2036018.1 DotU family type IV/VI secretion system protein [Francisella tularensis subsp. novicida]MBK2115944.1 DotU family type IV/VI secretion system prot
MHQDVIEVFVSIDSFIKKYDSNIEMHDIIAFRDDIIMKTNNIRDMIYLKHGERASFYITFAIYAYCDEMINQLILNIDSNMSNWHLLQEEVYQRNDGGDYFFEIIESVIDNPVFPMIVAQVLYLILALGFKGCYVGMQSEIDKYKNKLSAILPDQDLSNFEYNTFIDNNNFKKTYRSRILKSLFVGIVCFPIFAYLGLWFIH